MAAIVWQGKDIVFSICWVAKRRKANNESIPHNEVISGDSLAINNLPRAHQKLQILQKGNVQKYFAKYFMKIYYHYGIASITITDEKIHINK